MDTAKQSKEALSSERSLCLFKSRLRTAATEDDVSKALQQALVEKYHTTETFVWLGDTSRGYRLMRVPEDFKFTVRDMFLAVDDPLVRFLKTGRHLYLHENEPDPAWHRVVKVSRICEMASHLVLFFPVFRSHLVGLMGLGPRFPMGSYGPEDFDLLTVLGGQAGSALEVTRIKEKSTRPRERKARESLPAFVLHDIKNTAGMLSLLRKNAPQHIHEPEFQIDMLGVIEEAVKRMERVEECLRMLKDEIVPDFQLIDLPRFLKEECRHLRVNLPSLGVILETDEEMWLETDPKLLSSILENLLLNSFQAGGERTEVLIKVRGDVRSGEVLVKVTDNGPGIPHELLPSLLFAPFKTTKGGGSGIGLWHVKRAVAGLGGSIRAGNLAEGGACFVLTLPLFQKGV